MSNWPANGNLTGKLSVGQGERGKSLEYMWRGTELGIRQEGEEEYQFVNLAGGGAGSSAREIELQVGNGFIQWRYKREEEWNNLIELSTLEGKQGPKGEQGLPGKDGKNGIDGTNGINGQDGANGKDGITPNISIGTVATLEAGQQATVTREGTKENPIFNFGIPKGESGDSSGSNNASIDDNTISTDKTWSSSKIEDFIHTNDDVIWSTVQGENLSVNYTKEGYLREVEIWGNTWQDEEELSNIQHLGELYVDSEGQPILDSQGRKQFKIEINNFNGNILPQGLNFEYGFVVDQDDGQIYPSTSGDFACKEYIEIPVLKDVPLYTNMLALGLQWSKISIYNKNKNHIKTVMLNDTLGVLPENTFYIRLGFVVSKENKNLANKIMLTYNEKPSSTTSYCISKYNKTTLLLPCQLMKVGNLSDRLYWDSSKGRYIIEKNIIDSSLTGLEDGWLRENALSKDEFTYFKLSDTLLIPNNVATTQKPTNIITSLPLSTYVEQNNNKFLSYFQAWNYHFIGVPNNYLDTIDINGFKKWLFNNNLRIITKSKPQLIETNITKQILLPCYKDKTHLFVTGGINGFIKAKAPVDGGKAIQSLSVKNTALTKENEEIKAINNIQDKLINTTMLATDEMYNLLEPLLAETLGERSVSKMVDMYVAMVQRGIKTIEQVPVRYREQVKKILDQLEK